MGCRLIACLATFVSMALVFISVDIGRMQPHIHGAIKLTSTPRHGGVYRFPLPNRPQTYDPAQAIDVVSALVVYQTHQRLIQFDSHLLIRPFLASNWEITESGRRYLFRLRDAERFHDGSFVTSRDVVHSLKRLLRSKAEGLLQPYLLKIKGAKEYAIGVSNEVPGLYAINDHELVMELTESCAPLLAALGMPQAGIVSAVQDPNIGSGPFQIANDRGSHVVLRRVSDMNEDGALLDEIDFAVYEGSALDQVYQDFKEGSIHTIPVSGQLKNKLDTIPGLKFQRRLGLNFFFYGLRIDNPALKDPCMRRLLAEAIDKNRIVEEVYQGQQMLATGIIPLGAMGSSPKARTIPPPCEPVIRPSRLEIVSQARTPEIEEEIRLVAEAWRALGVQAKARYVTDWKEFEKYVRLGPAQVFRCDWFADTPDTDSLLSPLFSSSGSWNVMRFNSSEVDSLLDQARQASNQLTRANLYQQIEDIIIDQAPIIPIFHRSVVYASKPEVMGLEFSPLGFHATSFASVWLRDQP